MHNILQQIEEKRRTYRTNESHEIRECFGYSDGSPEEITSKRTLPFIPFFSHKGLICELKKASPSRGVINEEDKLEDVIREYIDGGAERFSVLTERSYFHGDWRFLHQLKQQHPEKGFLRKDFLMCRDDLIDSCLLGADAVLLISELLNPDRLEDLILYAHKLGLQVLCEVHSAQTLAMVLKLNEFPDAIGINSRDLTTFQVNTRIPFALKQLIPSSIPVVMESGIRNAFDAGLAGNADFDALLIGETLMRADDRSVTVHEMTQAFHNGRGIPKNFFTRLMERYRSRPLVKICGITRFDDAVYACRAGADVLGFILAPSKRQISIDELKRFRHISALKVAVVMDPDEHFAEQLKTLVYDGIIDGIQLHGDESTRLLQSMQGYAYKAVVPTTPDDAAFDNDPFTPLSLFDRPKGVKNDSLHSPFDEAYSKVLHRSFLAGGISSENLEDILNRFDPLFVDIASSVEKSPGIKDRDKIDVIFGIIRKKYE